MTVIPRRLTPAEHAAVRHLLVRSALADCPGTLGRITLTDDGDLTIQRVDDWRWSHGELELLEVLDHILGRGRWPTFRHLDETNQLVAREAMRMLTDDAARSRERERTAGGVRS